MTEVFVSALPNRKNDISGGEDAIYNEDPIGAPVLGYGYCCSQGRRSANEDRVAIKTRINGKPELAFFGVFDGHAGDRASDFCAKQIPLLAASTMESILAADDESNAQELLAGIYREADRVFCEQAAAGGWVDGSTACSVIVSGRSLYALNAGDSRAVLCRLGRPLPLTDDHKPSGAAERARIEAAGGEVVVADGVARVCGVIATSRSIGDAPLKRYVTAEPDVACRRLRHGDEFLLLGTDGLWDHVSAVQACAIASQANNARRAAEQLVDYALHNASLDNVAAVVVDLRSLFAAGVNADPRAGIPLNTPQKVKAMADAVARKFDFSQLPPDASGWLQKESRGGLMGKRWQRRYFLLHSVAGDAQRDSSVHQSLSPMVYLLHYHDSEEAARKTNPRKPTFVDPALGASREHHFDRPGVACLSLFEMSTGQPFILGAQDEAEADDWVARLNAAFARSGILPASAAASPPANRAGRALAGDLPQGLDRTLLLRDGTRTLTGMAAADPNAVAGPAGVGETAMPNGMVQQAMDGSLVATGPLQLRRTVTGGLEAVGGNWQFSSSRLAEEDVHCTVGIPKAGSMLTEAQCRALGVPAGSVLVA